MNSTDLLQSETFKHLQLTAVDFSPTQASSEFENHSVVVSNLISQNDDLSSRFKILLQKFHSIESQIFEKEKQIKNLVLANSRLEDQLLIWKEKEIVWKERSQKNSIKAEEVDHLRSQLKLIQFEADSYLRLKEKLKNQVKPYVKDLKNMIQSLSRQNVDMQRVINNLESQNIQSNQERELLVQKLASQEQSFESDLVQITESFENERMTLKNRMNDLTKKCDELQPKAEAVGPLLIELDLAKNNEVLLKRQNSDLQEQFVSEADLYRKQILELKMNLQLEKLQKEQLTQQNIELEKQKSFYENQFDKTEEDLQRTRFLLTNKSEECDKLKLALAALEKMNYDLLHKKSVPTVDL